MDVTKLKNFANKPLSPEVQTARMYCTRYATSPNHQQIYSKMLQGVAVVPPDSMQYCVPKPTQVKTTFRNLFDTIAPSQFTSNTMPALQLHFMQQFIPVNNNMNDFQNLSVMKNGCQPINLVHSNVNINLEKNMPGTQKQSSQPSPSLAEARETPSPKKTVRNYENHEPRQKPTKSPNKMYYRNLIEELTTDKRSHCKSQPHEDSQNPPETYKINPKSHSFFDYELLFAPPKKPIPQKFKRASKKVEDSSVNSDDFICLPPNIELYSSPFSKSEDDFVMLDKNSIGKSENRRVRTWSDCESEDSFIVFDGDVEDSSDQWDEQSSISSTIDADSDSDCDETDCPTWRHPENIKKKVQFKTNSQLCVVHPMVQWRYAYHNARKGPWEEQARDRGRFQYRIRQCNDILSPILKKNHRERIYKDRFETAVLE